GVVKAILTRGSGGRGYSPTGCENPTRIVARSSYPAHYLQWREQGITLALSPVALARNPLLAGLKHLNRLEQVLIRAHLDQTAADEALVLDTAGMLVECCAANLFWRKGKAVFTPDLSQAGVAGLMRRRVIALLAGSEYRLHCVSEPLETLADADEVLVSNALMPLLPVNVAQSWRYHSRQLYDFLRPHC
ncbi:TPA: aminodeoxychorismate lyase, partial [Serratia marcescens]